MHETTPTARKKERGADVPRLLQRHPQVATWAYHWVYFGVSDLRRCWPHVFRTTRTAQHAVQQLRSAGYLTSIKPGYQHQQHLHAVTRRLAEFVSAHVGRAVPTPAARVTSPFLLEHERAVSDFQSDLYTGVTSRADLSIPAYQRHFGRSNPLTYRDEGGTHALKPDLAFLLLRQQRDGGVRPLFHAVEIDRGRESARAVADKLVQYWRWYDGVGREQLLEWYRPYGEHRPVYRLLVVTEHRDREGDHGRQLALWVTQCLLVAPRLPLLIATAPEVAAHRRGASGRIWYGLHFFKQVWPAELAEIIERRPRINAAYDYVAEKLAVIEDRLELLPPPA